MGTKTVQKCSNLSIEFVPIPLPLDLPICGGQLHEQGDRPIRHLHFHGCLELGLCHAGHGVFVVGSKILPFSSGDVAFIEGGEVHLARSAPGTTSSWSWVYLDPVLLAHTVATPAELDPSAFAGPDFCNIFHGDAQPQVGQIVACIVRELGDLALGHERMLRLLTAELMLTMRRGRPTRSHRPQIGHSQYERIGPALGRLATGQQNGTSLAELAALCGLSPAHFRRIFAKTMGRTPREYAVDLKMRFACSLLRGSNRSILNISAETGFESVSSFNRTFQKTHGMSPRDWRKSNAVRPQGPWTLGT